MTNLLIALGCVRCAGCDGAPWLPFLYVASNLAFNVSALNLLKMSSAIVSSLTMTLAGGFQALL